jgi:hypothetical protein
MFAQRNCDFAERRDCRVPCNNSVDVSIFIDSRRSKTREVDGDLKEAEQIVRRRRLPPLSDRGNENYLQILRSAVTRQKGDSESLTYLNTDRMFLCTHR